MKLTTEQALTGYLSGLWPEFSDEILEVECISRSADFREILARDWEQLSEEERAKVRLADSNLIAHAAEAAPFWLEDQTAEDREELKLPLEHWWWWIDQVAAGEYPEEFLPRPEGE